MWILALLACPPPCPDGRACVVAGTGRGGYDGDGLPALESGLYLPTDVFRWPDGRLGVVDYNNYRLRGVDDAGALVDVAGSGEHAYATPGATWLASAFENPVDAEVRDDGAVIVAVQHEGRVLVLRDDTVEVLAGTGVIADGGDGGPALDATLVDPAGLALDGDDVYVSDDLAHRVRRVRDGQIETVLGPDVLLRPWGLAVHEGALLVADTGHHRIVGVDLATGDWTVVAGTGTAGHTGDGGAPEDAQLRAPQGVASADGAIYVADSGNHVLRRIADGGIATIAGTGVPAPLGDPEPPLEAPLSFPVGVYVEGEHAYVSCMLGNQIVRVPIR